MLHATDWSTTLMQFANSSLPKERTVRSLKGSVSNGGNKHSQERWLCDHSESRIPFQDGCPVSSYNLHAIAAG